MLRVSSNLGFERDARMELVEERCKTDAIGIEAFYRDTRPVLANDGIS